MISEGTQEFLIISILVLLIVGGFSILIVSINYTHTKNDIQCQELGWEEGAGYCYCKNTTYDVNTGEATIIKREYNDIFKCHGE